jgi:Tfp pilus assembly protein PilO
MTSTTRIVLVVLLIVALAVAFWALALGPKRDEASRLGGEVEEAEASLAQHRGQAARGAAARREFPVDYQQVVVLGKAVPADDDTASLFVQLNRISDRAEVRFKDLKLTSTGGESAPAPAPPAPSPTPAPATEVAASMVPLGASIGPAGLAVMPYELTFEGGFSKLADFLGGLDALVKTQNANVAVNGRLITIDGFSLSANPVKPFPELSGQFLVTTYLAPAAQGATGGATLSGPGPETQLASTTTGGTP